jgi:putative ABC transport system permease protein
MKLAWKEIKHSKNKFLLIELILVLMIFMVIFLSGLANGLARAVSAAIENADATHFILSENSEDLITLSSLNSQQLEAVKQSTSEPVAVLNIQRMNLKLKGTDNKLDVTYFAIQPEEFLNPQVFEGNRLTTAANTIVLDDAFLDEGIQLGDIVEDSSSGIEMTVVGFTKDAMYGHISVGYISSETYNSIRLALNPSYQPAYHTFAVQGSDTQDLSLSGLELVDKQTIVDSIPGYSAEQTTIRMILWVLVVISGAILGVFFYVITIQKQKQFGVMKAIGMKMSEIAGIIISQIALLAVFGVAIGNLLAYLMASVLPNSMPFYLKAMDDLMVSVAFIIISILCGLLSTGKIAKVDPLITIGGNE